MLHEGVFRRVGADDGFLNGNQADLVALEYCLGRKGFQAVAGKAIEVVHDDSAERLALRSRISQYLLERFTFLEDSAMRSSPRRDILCQLCSRAFPPNRGMLGAVPGSSIPAPALPMIPGVNDGGCCCFVAVFVIMLISLRPPIPTGPVEFRLSIPGYIAVA